jgi:hypothetical protein
VGHGDDPVDEVAEAVREFVVVAGDEAADGEVGAFTEPLRILGVYSLFLVVAAELLAHRGERLRGEVVQAAGE